MKIQILILTIISLSLICDTTSNLKFVFKLVSEGARAPYTSLNTNNQDMFGEAWTNNGVLTPVGYRMLYLLGTKDRQRYSSLLSSSYNSKELYARSGWYNSTQMSANAYLQGLFPPSTGPTLIPSQRAKAYPPVSSNYGDFNELTFGKGALPNQAQVFSIQSFDQKDRKYFFIDFSLCNHFWNKYDSNTNENNVKNWLANFQKTYGNNLLRVLNMNDITKFLDYNYVKGVLLTYIADYTEGKTLQRFTDNGIDLGQFNSTAYEFANMDMYQVVSGYQTDAFYPNATMSGFKDEISTWMSNVLKADKNLTEYTPYDKPKFSVFFVPQYVLGGIVAYIARDKGTNLNQITFASSLSFELRLNNEAIKSSDLTDSNYSVDYFLDGSLLKTISFTEFVDILNRAWVEESVRVKCSNNLIDRYGFKNATIVLAVLLGVATIILIILLIFCCKKPKSAEE